MRVVSNRVVSSYALGQSVRGRNLRPVDKCSVQYCGDVRFRFDNSPGNDHFATKDAFVAVVVTGIFWGAFRRSSPFAPRVRGSCKNGKVRLNHQEM